jgi:hypothetical protein
MFTLDKFLLPRKPEVEGKQKIKKKKKKKKKTSIYGTASS